MKCRGGIDHEQIKADAAAWSALERTNPTHQVTPAETIDGVYYPEERLEGRFCRGCDSTLFVEV